MDVGGKADRAFGIGTLIQVPSFDQGIEMSDSGPPLQMLKRRGRRER